MSRKDADPRRRRVVAALLTIGALGLILVSIDRMLAGRVFPAILGFAGAIGILLLAVALLYPDLSAGARRDRRPRRTPGARGPRSGPP